MTDRPILFSGPMIRALLNGRKSMTRRIIKDRGCLPEFCGGRHDDKNDPEVWGWQDFERGEWITLDQFRRYRFVPYSPRDRLWVRETWATVNSGYGPGWAYRANSDFMQPEYDGEDFGAGPSFDYDKYPGEYCMWFDDLLSGAPGHGWKSSIHMPRWASRLTLTVTDVRVHRVQEISRGDAMEEGCPFANMAAGPNPRDWFAELWNGLNAKRGFGWDANPWVVAISFDVHRCNIDQMETGQ